MVKISASILAADFTQLGKEIKAIEPLVDMLHIDVMDGHFVPNFTMGPYVVECIRKTTKLPMDVHLMIEHPEQYIASFAKAGASMVSFHPNATKDIAGCIALAKKLKLKVGLAINPDISVKVLDPYLSQIDYVLIMSVYAGFAGQSFIPDVLDKIKQIRKRSPKLTIEIDGGINDKTASLARVAGATILVSASYLFGSKDKKAAVALLRGGNHVAV
ncbi:ribulose-phosphate 3-epimerase [Candidatus Woesearchaeota archaeon]|nr:ribulose-phosphate 3-epimerase [Candidatus Woesearchaeota archaeon]